MTDSIKALAFGPSLPASGAQGALVFTSGSMELHVNDTSKRVPLSQLQLREVGFGESGLELAWHDNEDWAVHVLNAITAKQLLESPAFASLPQTLALKSRQRRHQHGRMVGWTVLGVFISLPLILLALFFLQVDKFVEWATDKIPLAEEVQLGRSSFASMRGELQLLDTGPAYQAVTNIGKRLTQGSRYSYEFHVAQDDTLNAFALPGGIVVVHTGLINATKRPEELAGVLAHEVQHVERRHSLQGMVKQLGLRAVWATVTGNLGGTLAGQAAVQLSLLKFSRDAESEADEHGFDLLVKTGIDPTGMADFFHTMSDKATDAPAAFISTHPLSKDRQQHLEARRKELAAKTFAPLVITPWPP